MLTTGLSHANNMHKMRLLTFMQMAEKRKEMDFELLQRELVLGPQSVEEFIIDGMSDADLSFCLPCAVGCCSVRHQSGVARIWPLCRTETR